MLLNVKDIRVHYGDVEAIKGVSINIEKETIVALIGGNGAGKTTILCTISALKTPTRGEIWFKGERIDKASASYVVRNGLIHVPERRRLFRNMSVFENLEMGAFLRKWHEAKLDIEKVFNHFPVLRERSNQRAGSLSGGEQQMLAIGRAIMAGPCLLLLDEPSIGLAPLIVEELGRVIKDLNSTEKVAVLLVEQNATMALMLANTVYVLETGQVVLQGLSENVKNDQRVKEAYLGLS